MKRFSIKLFIISTALILLLYGHASAAVKISSIPQPPPTAKLRVFALILTHEIQTSRGPKFWLVSPAEMKHSSLLAIGNILKAQGIYEVVTQADINTATGEQSIATWKWTAKDYALAKEVGRALHADYVFILERSFRIHLQMDMNLINMSTGRQFAVSNYVPDSFLKRLGSNDQRMKAGAEAVKISYRRLFADAKSDLLQTAMHKGRISATELPSSVPVQPPSAETKKPPAEKHPTPVAAVSPEKSPQDSPSNPPRQIKSSSATVRTENKAAVGQTAFEKELSEKMTTQDKRSSTPRLVVYDIDAGDRLKIVGLILTEALREELYHAGGFILINRENILKIMDEYKLQQSGAVDENSAVKVGKWLAASEAITGTLGVLGSTSILQVKRIDIQTLGTISLGSVKCQAGSEDNLLDQMPQLARKLIKSP